MPEHLWGKKLNRLKALWHAQNEDYIFFYCFLIREYWNHDNKQKRSLKKYYWDEPVQNFTFVRLYKDHVKKNEFHIPTIQSLRALNYTPIESMKRKSFLGKIRNKYVNIFYKEGDIGWIHHPFIAIEKQILNVYKKDSRDNVNDNIMLNNMMRYAFDNCDNQWTDMGYEAFFFQHKNYMVEFRNFNRPFSSVNPYLFRWNFFTAKGHEDCMEMNQEENKNNPNMPPLKRFKKK